MHSIFPGEDIGSGAESSGKRPSWGGGGGGALSLAVLGRPMNWLPWGGRSCLSSCLLHDPNATRTC